MKTLSPFCYPDAKVSSRWVGESLVWNINGKEISDASLRTWCYINLNYPWCYADVIRQYHVNAYAAHD